MASLTLTDLACQRGGRLLFEGLSLTVGPGELAHIKGSNGSGKSSLLRLVAGFGEPYKGRIILKERDDVSAPQDCLFLMEEQTALKPAETLVDSLKCWASLMGYTPSADDLISAIDRVNLLPLMDIETRQFSTGQRRRAALARLALGGRPIWLLDEPMNGLDTPSRDLVQGIISDHRSSGGIVMVASHDSVFADASELSIDSYRPSRPLAGDPFFDDTADFIALDGTDQP